MNPFTILLGSIPIYIVPPSPFSSPQIVLYNILRFFYSFGFISGRDICVYSALNYIHVLYSYTLYYYLPSSLIYTTLCYILLLYILLLVYILLHSMSELYANIPIIYQYIYILDFIYIYYSNLFFNLLNIYYSYIL